MAISLKSAEFLISAQVMGASFKSTCTLGRAYLFVTPGQLAKLLKRYGCLPPDYFQTYTPYSQKEPNPFCEPFLQILGAEQIDSTDNSKYEGATIIHDLNVPIPDQFKERYDAVIDAGTLEHVFNFPVAIKNAMEMVKENGYLFIDTCANNSCGHGFYQFSPELFYRALSPENGFEIQRMLLYQHNDPQIYEVVDPAKIGQRVELINRKNTTLMVQAKRIRVAKIFENPPQQSDYTATWVKSESSSDKPAVDPAYKAWLRARLSPEQVQTISMYLNRLRLQIAFWRYNQMARLRNKKFFKPIDIFEQTISAQRYQSNPKT
jgi:hypothetical protein